MNLVHACLLSVMLAGCAAQGGSIETYGVVDVGVSHANKSAK